MKKQYIIIALILAFGLGFGIRFYVEQNPEVVQEKYSGDTSEIVKDILQNETHIVYGITDLENKGNLLLYKTDLTDISQFIGEITFPLHNVLTGRLDYSRFPKVYTVTPNGRLYYEINNSIKAYDLKTKEERVILTVTEPELLTVFAVSDDESKIAFQVMLFDSEDTYLGEKIYIFDRDSNSKEEIEVPELSVYENSNLAHFCSGSHSLAITKLIQDNEANENRISLYLYDSESHLLAEPQLLSKYSHATSRAYSEGTLFSDRIAPDCNHYVEYLEAPVDSSEESSYNLVNLLNGKKTTIYKKVFKKSNIPIQNVYFSDDSSKLITERWGNSAEDPDLPSQHTSKHLLVFDVMSASQEVLIPASVFREKGFDYPYESTLSPDSSKVIFLNRGSNTEQTAESIQKYSAAALDLKTLEATVFQKNNFPINKFTGEGCFFMLATGEGTPAEMVKCEEVFAESEGITNPAELPASALSEQWIYLGQAAL